MRRKLPLLLSKRKRLRNEFSKAGQNHSVSVWQEPWLCWLGWAESVHDEFSEGYKETSSRVACLATDALEL